MDKEKAKFFILNDEFRTHNIYTSKSLDTILEQSDGKLFCVYAVCDTPNGEKLFHMDWSYANVPIIMRVFLHLDYFKEAFGHLTWIDLDKR